MKSKFKAIVCLAMVIAIFVGSLPAYAAITDVGSVNKMMSLIDSQNFNGTTSLSSVKNYINHFTYNSEFAAFYGRAFNYPNNSPTWFYTISDGTYTKNVGGAKGCYAHSTFVAMVVYGQNGSRKYHTEKARNLTGTGLKNFLLKEAQAGEHLRIDNTHSVVFVSGDANGFYYFSYNGDNYGRKITLEYKSYADFAAKYNYVNSSSQSSVWLYNANTNTNTQSSSNNSGQVIADGVYVIASKLNTNYALDIADGSTADYANLQLWRRNSTQAQSFRITHIGSGYYRITNIKSGKAIDAEWGGTTAGTNVWQYPVNNTPAQTWKIVNAGNGYYSIICQKSGLYLDLNNANVAYGENIKLWTSNGSDAQKWKFIRQ